MVRTSVIASLTVLVVFILVFSAGVRAEYYDVMISKDTGDYWRIELVDMKMRVPYCYEYKYYYDTILEYYGKGNLANQVKIEDTWYWVDYLMGEWRPSSHDAYRVDIKRIDSKTAEILRADMILTVKWGYLPYGTYYNCYLEYGGSKYDDFLLIDKQRFNVDRIDIVF